MAKFVFCIFLLVFSTVNASAASSVDKEFRRLSNVDGKLLFDHAYKYVERCQYDSALIYYSTVANRYYAPSPDRNTMRLAVKAMIDIGIIYMTRDYDFRKAYEYLLQAQEIAEENGIKKDLANIYICIANIMQISKPENDAGASRQVAQLIRKAFYCSIDEHEYNTATLALANLISVTDNGAGHEDIGSEIDSYLRLDIPKNTENRIYTILVAKGYRAFRRGNYETALRLFQESAKRVDQSPLAYRSVISSYRYIYNVYKARRQYSLMRDNLLMTADIARRHDATDYLVNIYSDLAETYRILGDSATAHEYDYLHLKAKSDMMDQGNLRSVNDVRFTRELNKANEQVRQMAERRRMQNMLLVAAAIVVCVFSLLLYRLVRAYRKIRLNNRHLYRTYTELLDSEAEARLQHVDDTRKMEILEQKLHDIEHQQTNAGVKPKYMNSRMTDDDTRNLYERIINVMNTSDEIFQLGFTMERLSELVHSKLNYVSQAINQEHGTNFNSLLNEYRIKEACRRLNGQGKYSNMTIEGIAESVGFKSRSNFGTLFKTATGLSPSAYQRMAREENRL